MTYDDLTWNLIQPSLQQRILGEFTQIPQGTDNPYVAFQYYDGRYVVQGASGDRPGEPQLILKTQAGNFFQDDEALQWLKANDPSEYLTLQYFNSLPPIIVPPKVVTPTDPSDPDTGITSVVNPAGDGLSLGSGYIKAIVVFDGLNVSADVISITTEQGTSNAESDGNTAKMTVTLSNKNNKYGKGQFTPHVTVVYSWIDIERNVISGLSVNVHTARYPLFFGRVSEVNMSEETCSIICGDEGVQTTASADVDLAFYVTEGLKSRVQRLVDALGAGTGQSTIDIEIDQDVATKLKVPNQTTSVEGVNAAITQTVDAFQMDWTVLSDEPHRLMIKDSTYIRNSTPVDSTAGTAISGTVNMGTVTSLDGFVVGPGDNQSIVGFCNHVWVVADSPFPHNGASQNVPSGRNALVKAEYPNAEEPDPGGLIKKYGKIEAPLYRMPSLATQEQCQQAAKDRWNIYKSYIDRFIKVKVCSIVPLLHTLVTWKFYDEPTHMEFDATDMNGNPLPSSHVIMGKIVRKCVNYDATNGVIVDLECQRINAEDMVASSSPTDGTTPSTWKYSNGKVTNPGQLFPMDLKVSTTERDSNGNLLFMDSLDNLEQTDPNKSWENMDLKNQWAQQQYYNMTGEYPKYFTLLI